MRRAVALILINLILVNSSVLVPSKNVEKKVGEPPVKETRSDVPRTFLFNGSYIYVEDVLFVLKNQNWTEEEQPCLDRTESLLLNLRNFTLWAAWNWDSLASEPQGLLYGSRYQLGNYDQCLGAPWYKDHEELRGQYCLADIVLERTDSNVKKKNSNPYDPYESALNVLEHESQYRRPFNRLTWAICVPDVCEKQSVVRLMGILLAHSHLGAAGLKAKVDVINCEKANQPVLYDWLFYSFFLVFGFLVILCVWSTLLNRRKSKYCNLITKAFDLKNNANNLMQVKKDGVEVLYGIRFFTIVIIVINHQFGILNGGPVSNGYNIDKDALSYVGLFVLHDDVTVDSFFWLSGFLTGKIFTSIKGSLNLPIMILKRYVRLVVAYAVVIYFVSAVYPYVGSGPLWQVVVQQDTTQCRANWWANLLMINNYYDTENLCIVVSWYIPCDFHFFVVTLLIYWVYRQYPKPGVVLAGLVAFAALIAPGIVNYLYNLPPIQLFTYDFVSNPRGQEQFHLTYIKSHTRYPAYIVGFLSGYMFVHFYTKKNKRISQNWAIVGTTCGLLLMMAVLFSGPPFLWRGYTMAESVLYAVFNRPVWAFSISLFLLSCTFGHVPLVKAFFSWYPWVPLSRLSYGLYLTHVWIITRNVFVTRNMHQTDYLELLTLSGGDVIGGCIVSLLIWLLVEAPINNLVAAMILPRKIGSVAEERETNYNGHLQDNLPPVVQIDSSKV